MVIHNMYESYLQVLFCYGLTHFLEETLRTAMTNLRGAVTLLTCS